MPKSRCSHSTSRSPPCNTWQTEKTRIRHPSSEGKGQTHTHRDRSAHLQNCGIGERIVEQVHMLPQGEWVHDNIPLASRDLHQTHETKEAAVVVMLNIRCSYNKEKDPTKNSRPKLTIRNQFACFSLFQHSHIKVKNTSKSTANSVCVFK